MEGANWMEVKRVGSGNDAGHTSGLSVPGLMRYSLKVIVAPFAIIAPGLHTTVLESGVQSCKDTSHFGLISQSIPYRHGQRDTRV
jgi:hypothetical protein